MDVRMDYVKAFPEGYQAMAQLERAVRQSGLEPLLLELVKTRASQMNGCAFCIDMHTKDARAKGETDQRLYALSAWRETPFFSERERAALAWTEAVTNIQQGHATDEAYAIMRREFDEAEAAKLTWAISAINVWNRIAISFRAEVGKYEAGRR